MTRLDPATWHIVSPLFDQALDLDAVARRRFVDEVAAADPKTGETLTRLLESHDRLIGSTFLDTPALAAEPDLAGTTIGAYTLDVPLGAGGMGVVWKAHRSDGRYEGAVALKLLQLAVLERHTEATFTLEGTLLARLSHPNIARLLDAGVTAAGQPYLVLEYVEGTRLDIFAETQRLDVPARLGLLLQVCDAVAHAHTHLVLHRDVKPSNVLVDGEGRVKLLDFGIGSWLDHEPLGGAPAGPRRFTPEYAAPEQVQGGVITTATDVYALGVLAAVLLTGRSRLVPPAPAPDGVAVRPLASDLDLVVTTAMKPDPAARYASVATFADDLRRYLAHEPLAVRGASVRYVVGRFVRRNRVAVALASVALMALVAGSAGIWVQSARAGAERDFALRQLARAESVNDMNAFLLSDAAPLGQSFTAGDLLTRAEALINRQPTDPVDAITVESLVSIGTQFQSQDEDGNARRVLIRAFDLASRLPAGNVATRAKAGCALANSLARGDHADLQRAQQLVQASLALLPDSRPLALDRAFCARMAGAVARHAGDSAADIAHTLTAQRVLRQSGLGSELAHVGVEMELAEAYRVAGRHVDADGAFRAVFTRLEHLGRDHTERAGTLLNNWALSLFFLGRPQEAEQAFRRALDISRADGGEASVSPMLLLNLARPVLELGRAAEAVALAERALAEARRLDDQVVQLQALIFSGGAYRNSGDLPRSATVFDEAERQLRQRLPPGHAAFASLALQRAILAQAGGHLASARDYARRAVEIAEASSQGGDVIGQALLRRAEVSVAESRYAAAFTDAARALQVESARIGAGQHGSRVGRVHFVMAQAQLGLMRRDDARASLNAALAHLTATLGDDHAETVHARSLLDTID